jgi:hypothetical protein
MHDKILKRFTITTIRVKKKLYKEFQKLQILQASLSINIHSKNTPRWYDGFLVPQNEYKPVYVKINYWNCSAYQRFLNDVLQFFYILHLIPSIQHIKNFIHFSLHNCCIISMVSCNSFGCFNMHLVKDESSYLFAVLNCSLKVLEKKNPRWWEISSRT